MFERRARVGPESHRENAMGTEHTGNQAQQPRSISSCPAIIAGRNSWAGCAIIHDGHRDGSRARDCRLRDGLGPHRLYRDRGRRPTGSCRAHRRHSAVAIGCSRCPTGDLSDFVARSARHASCAARLRCHGRLALGGCRRRCRPAAIGWQEALERMTSDALDGRLLQQRGSCQQQLQRSAPIDAQSERIAHDAATRTGERSMVSVTAPRHSSLSTKSCAARARRIP